MPQLKICKAMRQHVMSAGTLPFAAALVTNVSIVVTVWVAVEKIFFSAKPPPEMRRFLFISLFISFRSLFGLNCIATIIVPCVTHLYFLLLIEQCATSFLFTQL